MGILDKIIKAKKEEVERRKRKHPLSELKPRLKDSDRNFKDSISKGFSIIAEIKKGSPSKGIINKSFSLEMLAKAYQKNRNVKAISVLTDKKFFFMGPSCLSTVRKLTKKPLLRKDFIIDPYQVYESRFYGADAILLIAAILPKPRIRNLIDLAKRYRMDCLVEVHSQEDIEKLPENAEIIGINNRDLDTLKIGLNTTLSLLSRLPKDKVVVSESGFNTSKDIKKVKDKVDAVLIGTSILKSKDISKKIDSLVGR
ncbi:indole-3-glycerol phosphate synthase TrpC [Candidatus Woesearchaeota archaeon]|nr:indole-3-glycerol phosphate synthase TrpC [Candidatus Woesearchaeota archaeon]